MKLEYTFCPENISFNYEVEVGIDDIIDFVMPKDYDKRIKDANSRKNYIKGARDLLYNILKLEGVDEVLTDLEYDSDFIDFMRDRYYSKAFVTFSKEALYR